MSKQKVYAVTFAAAIESVDVLKQLLTVTPSVPRSLNSGRSFPTPALLIQDTLSLLIQQNPEFTVHLLKHQITCLTQRDPMGATSLHLGIRKLNREFCAVLLYFDLENALVDCRGENGCTAIHECVLAGRKSLEILR